MRFSVKSKISEQVIKRHTILKSFLPADFASKMKLANYIFFFIAAILGCETCFKCLAPG